MAGPGHRTFSFETHDDDPSYYPLHPDLPPPPQHRYHHQQQPKYAPLHPSYLQTPQQHRAPSDSSWDHLDVDDYSPPHRMASDASSQGVGIEHQNTVIRKSMPPEAAAAAAAALAAVQEDLVPSSANDGRDWAPELGYARSASAEPPHHGPETPTYPPQASTPSSQAPLLAGRPPPPPHHWVGQQPGEGSPGRQRVLIDPVLGQYTDNPYKRMSTTWDPALSQTGFDAHDVLSDDDDDMARGNGPKKSALGLGAPAAAAVGGGGLRGGALENGGLLGGSAGSGQPDEKSDWLRSNENSKKKTRWIVGIFVLLLVLGIAGGVTAGVLVSQKKGGGGGSSSGSSSNTPDSKDGNPLTAEEDVRANGDLTKDSKEIKELMNNPDLHKVFHGMDYTPLGGVYPECLTWPPTQNNITRDIAVLSLLTDKVRLYSTDCNQTEMVLHAIDTLEVDMKVWIGVWLDKNTTTNERQLNHLYKLLEDEKHHDKYAGVAVGNEVLFAETLTETELFSIISGVRTNLTNLNYDIPVGTSDLGSNWNAQMAAKVDVLMANVHPFFAGVVAEEAADWTWEFFTENDVVLTENLSPKPRVMISEVGWPSGGGKNNGSVAGIDEMNTFMDGFVCRENKRGTEYFWFSGFDEPWKIRYNEPKEGKEWEDKWGLLDIDRVLKKGLKIPDCQ